MVGSSRNCRRGRGHCGGSGAASDHCSSGGRLRDSRRRRGERRGVGRRAAVGRCLQVRLVRARTRPGIGSRRRYAPVLPRRCRWNGLGPAACRRVDAGDRREGRCLECRRHADAEAAGAPAADAPRAAAQGRHHRSGQRRHARGRTQASGRARDDDRDLARSHRRSRILRGRQWSSACRSTSDRDRFRRALAPPPRDHTVRRHHLRAVQSMDGRCGVPLHTRVLPRCASRARAGRHSLSVGAHVRHQQRRSAVDRGDVRVRVPRRHDVDGRAGRRPADRIAGRNRGAAARHRSVVHAPGRRSRSC